MEKENCKPRETNLLDLHEIAIHEIFDFLNEIDIYCGCRNVCRMLRKYADTYLPCVGTFLCVTGVSDSRKNDDFPLFKYPVDIDVKLLYVFKRERNGRIMHVSSEPGPPITVSPESFISVDKHTYCDPSFEYIKRLVNFKILDIFGSVINGKIVIGMYIDEMFAEELSTKEGKKTKHFKSNVCSNVTPIIYYCDVDVHIVSYTTDSSIMIGLHVYRDSLIPPGYDFKVVKFRFVKNQEHSMKSNEFGMKVLLNQNGCNHGLYKFSDIRYQVDFAVCSEYNVDLGQTIVRIEGTRRTLDQMNRHNPISYFTSGDFNYGDLDYPCPRNINGNVMTLTRKVKESYETFKHQMFSNLWENSGALEATWGKVPIEPLLSNWERYYLKLKDEVFIFEGPRHFDQFRQSTGISAKKYDLKTKSENEIRCQNFKGSCNDIIQTVVIDKNEEFVVMLCTDITVSKISSCPTKIIPQISVFARDFHIEHRHDQENVNFTEYYWSSTEMSYSYWLGNWREILLQIK